MLCPRAASRLTQTRAGVLTVAVRACRSRRGLASMTVVAHSSSSSAGARPGQTLSVAVIGAGAAGLVTARELLREGHSVRVFEQSPHLGGVWHYTEEVEDDLLGVAPGRKRVHGSMYSELRTNLPREVMGFLDFPFDAHFPGSKDPRQFCSHAEVLRYLEAFAAAFDLASVVETCTQVVTVRPPAALAGGGVAAGAGGSLGQQQQWEVTLRRAGSSSTSSDGGSTGSTGSSSVAQADADEVAGFEAVVVCNGHYSEPRVPSFPGQTVFPGRQMHSHNYRTAAPFAGQTVLLVGASSSGVDIAQELAAVGARVFLCAREWENPLTGETIDVSTSASAAAQPGEVVRSANIHELHASGAVTLESGATIPQVDTVMYCTGYRYSFPFLEGTGIIGVEDNRVGPLYQHIFPPAYAPGLSFVGLPWKVVPFPQFELQSKWIAQVLSGRAQLPSVQEMGEEVQRFYADLEERGVAVRYTHRQAGEVQWRYNQWLAEACGPDVPGWPQWRCDMYAATGNSRKLHADSYRDKRLPEAEACEAAAREEAAAVRAAVTAQLHHAQQQAAVC